MKVLISTTIREMVKNVNELEIDKSDIVSFLKEGEQFMLIYYK